MDIRGRRGKFSKSAYLFTNRGFKSLTMKADIPTPEGMVTGSRLRNVQIALTDRQAVFRGTCANCHGDTAQGKQGRALFRAVCSICHEAEHRASMVPDLRNLDHPTSAEHWRQWIAHGKDDTLMPAFAESDGGPLSEQQIESLVSYMIVQFPTKPAVAARPEARYMAM